MEYTYTVTFHGDYFSLTTHITVDPKPMDDPETLAIDLAANMLQNMYGWDVKAVSHEIDVYREEM